MVAAPPARGGQGPGLGLASSAKGGTDPRQARLAVVVVAAGVLAAWGAVRWGFCQPLLWLVVMLAWLALPVTARRGLPLLWLVPGTLVLAVGLVVARDHELAVRHTTAFTLAVLLFGLARLAAPGEGQLRWLALGVAGTTVLVFLQVGGGMAAALGNLDALPPGLREAAAIRLSVGRAFGSAALPGHYAALVLTVVPLLWRWAETSRGRYRLLPVAALACVAVALYLTRSLAVLGVGVVLLAVALLRGRRRWVVWAGVVVVLGLAVAVALQRSDLGSLQPVRLRFVNWQVAWWVIRHHPALGVGLGGVGQAGLKSPWAGGNITPYTHNTPLQLVGELGVAGLPLVVAAALGLVSLLRRGAREQPHLAMAVAVVPLHNLVDFSLYSAEVLLPWAVLVGTLAARTTPLPARAVPSSWLVPVLAAGTLVASLEWRCDAALAEALAAPHGGSCGAAVEAARWAPWRVRPVVAAAELALAGRASARELERVEALLTRRHWVQPASAGWAELRARLLLAQGRRGEALVWVREARRRGPAGRDLKTLEALCR